MSTLETQVGGLANGLGEFFRHELPLSQRPGGSIPVFRQVLDTTRYTVAFDPGSPTFQILANDQNRLRTPMGRSGSSRTSCARVTYSG